MLKVKKIQLQQPVRSCFWCLSRLFIYLLGTTSAAWGQVIPDGTLPQNTVVTPKGNMRVIEQGTRIGDNLFHSFSVFSLPTGAEIGKAEALRQAQMVLLRNVKYEHPFYWAPFILVGNWL